MTFAGYELMYLFFIYGILGWILETVFASTRQRKFVKRGLINGPFCMVYGVAAVVMTVGLYDLSGFWLFAGAVICASMIEWIAGHLIEKLYKERRWNYAGIKWNIDGYICVPVSLFWGALGFVMMKWGNPMFIREFSLFPRGLRIAVLWIGTGIFLVDILASYILLTGRSGRLDRWKTDVFAAGCGFYKIVLLFFIAAFLGDVLEMIFCRMTDGIWMSRSSVVWGPFSIVWGLAIALGTAMLYQYRNYSDGVLFLAGTLIGGAYEYLCSVFTEVIFGKVFWDYSAMPFNLGGRINLLYCFFWGIAAVLWLKKCYPLLSGWIEKIPKKTGTIVTWCLIVFMCLNIMVSSVALSRFAQREDGIPADGYLQQWVDVHYTDEVMERIYPNAVEPYL